VADSEEPVVLTVPRGSLALSAMRVVVGWVASCNDVALDELDDIDLAIETLLAGEQPKGATYSLSVSAGDGSMHVLLGGLQSKALRANLQAGKAFAASADWPLDIRLFLGALVDGYEVVGCGAATFAVSMQKRIR
jgi:hypothetical protein